MLTKETLERSWKQKKRVENLLWALRKGLWADEWAHEWVVGREYAQEVGIEKNEKTTQWELFVGAKEGNGTFNQQ